jgi:hypothetical protein
MKFLACPPVTIRRPRDVDIGGTGIGCLTNLGRRRRVKERRGPGTGT